MRGQEQPTIHGAPDLILRPWSPMDASVVRAAFADPDIRHWHMRELVSDDEAIPGSRAGANDGTPKRMEVGRSQRRRPVRCWDIPHSAA
jgi:hypothetical protein